ncbi:MULTISPECIES: hypothetical protein [unclassified Streptomyces]|uniref:hypothetical protein n=1 Tax=unclassified Streptomyces TaxID=2593676 RepID=UPI0007F3DF9E|nr:MULTISPECIES: hypothetical protein [unclassified Streptomyces]MCM1973745.1 hypothetical protein [Streptomyces sp. G1]SBT95763.1 hypothetical protein GA0115233_116611 [Streptomyces sp. DI166]
MPAVNAPGRYTRRTTRAVVGATVVLVALAGCGSGTTDSAASGGKRSPKASSNGGTEAAELIRRALDATFDQEYLHSTRRKKDGETTTLRVALGGDQETCEAHSRSGAAYLDFVVTESALYTRGSQEALELSPESKADPARAEVMADRWVKRGAAMSESFRGMCAPKTRRDWLEERLPALDRLAEDTPVQESVRVAKRAATKITYERADGPLEFYVAAEGTPFLLRVTSPATDLDESFSDFGKTFRVAAPSGAVTELQMAEEVLAAQ